MKNVFLILMKIFIVIIILQIIFMINNTSRAEGFWSNIFKFGDNFLNRAKEEAADGEIVIKQREDDDDYTVISLPNDTDLNATISDLYNILLPLGVVITVVIGGVLGIKFMMASAEDKAKIKEMMIPYVVGCAVIYGAFMIWSIAIKIFSI